MVRVKDRCWIDPTDISMVKVDNDYIRVYFKASDRVITLELGSNDEETAYRVNYLLRRNPTEGKDKYITFDGNKSNSFEDKTWNPVFLVES